MESNEKSRTFGFISFGIGFILLLLVGIVVVEHIANTSNTMEYDNSGFLSVDNFTSTSLSNSLSPIGDGITTQSFSKLNDTWIHCDGSNDYIKITPSSNDTLSFWYNSSNTSGWTFVANVLGITYVNGTVLPITTYPVYWDGSNYYFCKTDATTFWEGDVDDIRDYDGGLTEDSIIEIYNGGRY